MNYKRKQKLSNILFTSLFVIVGALLFSGVIGFFWIIIHFISKWW